MNCEVKNFSCDEIFFSHQTFVQNNTNHTLETLKNKAMWQFSILINLVMKIRTPLKIRHRAINQINFFNNGKTAIKQLIRACDIF